MAIYGCKNNDLLRFLAAVRQRRLYLELTLISRTLFNGLLTNSNGALLMRIASIGDYRVVIG